MWTYALLGVLQLVVVARYAVQINWGNGFALVYLAFLGSVVVTGAFGVMLARRAA
jgi:hypothetical protein